LLFALSLGIAAAGCNQDSSDARFDASGPRADAAAREDAASTTTLADAASALDAGAAIAMPDAGDAGIPPSAIDASSGGCAANSDCPPDLPVCNSSHICAAPAVTPPAALTYSALIITNDAYADAFQQLALLHTLTGVPTRVVTVETICGATTGGCSVSDACHDTSKAIKEYVVQQNGAGLRHVVLGGDMSIVPSRQTHDSFSNAILGVSYDETFYSDYYFADFSQWDTNGDCTYGDPASDSPDYLPEIDVTRISVSSPSELQTYVGKVQSYLTAYDTTRIDTALFLSNVATELTIPSTTITVPVDSALYFETQGRTLSFIPGDFTITKLYSSMGGWSGATTLTVAAEQTAFVQGANLVVHSGHGDPSDLTVEQDGSKEFTGAMAYALQNTQYPIMLSCACEGATFADGDGSAGQNFITAPEGGGIGYLGNSTIGLGIAGGMQLIDQVLKYAFATPGALVGDAVRAGHANLPTSDDFTFTGLPIVDSLAVPVVDANSWRWTEKAAAFLGDGLLPVYTKTLAAPPGFSVTDQRLGNFVTINLQPAAPATGTLAVAVSGNVYQFAFTASATPVSLTVGGSPSTIEYGFSSPTTLASHQQVSLP
jgi:hypothetical protein